MNRGEFGDTENSGDIHAGDGHALVWITDPAIVGV
jgi:hypothetical protein